jgi:tetratricopeptide (TPR) repeat protein
LCGARQESPEFGKSRREGTVHRVLLTCFAVMWAATIGANVASAQMGPGGQGAPIPGRGSAPTAPEADEPSAEPPEKSEAAAKKAFKAGMKSLNKAKEYEAIAATSTNSDKKAKALEKVGDAYNSSLDEFTEALSNKGDMVDAWDNVGYVHLRLGAYTEAIDDYNHALALKPDLAEATEHRAEAYLAVDRLDDAKIAYMDLFNHSPPLADQLMVAMRKWVSDHRTNPHGMRTADVESFDKWLMERDGIAKQAVSLPH